jgi:hypothetical protein
MPLSQGEHAGSPLQPLNTLSRGIPVCLPLTYVSALNLMAVKGRTKPTIARDVRKLNQRITHILPTEMTKTAHIGTP